VPRPAPKARRSPLLPFYVILGVVALGGAFLLYRQTQGGGAAASTLQQVVMTPEQLQRVPGISQGNANAPIVVMEFADFQCPACGGFARFSKPLIKDYLDNGTIRFVWYDFPLVQLHKNAVLASRAGRCANEQNQFWAYHDVVFTNQSRWSESEKAAGHFEEYAEQAGLDSDAFKQCLRSEKYQKEVSESYQLGTTLGVSGTPTLFVNGKRIETPRSRAEWDQLIQAEMGTGAAPAATAPAATAPAPAAAGTAP
jgi:protein-disulfide isomerase